MNTLEWILLAINTTLFLLIGILKLITPLEVFMKRMHVQGHWQTAVSNRTYKLSGFFEILGAFGLIVPALASKAEFLIPLAALGLVMLTSLAVGVHVGMTDRGPSRITPTVLIVLLTIFLILTRNDFLT